MDVDVFVAEHRADWARLDQLTRRRRRLSGAEVDELVALYQRTAAQLSAVQAAGLDPGLSGALSSQLARARAAVTGAQPSSWNAIGRFAAVSFPAAAYRARWWWLGCAVASIVVALLVGWEVARSPALQASLLPKSEARQLVTHDFRHYYSTFDGRSFAARVWTNNALLAAEAVTFGLLLGLPVLFVLFENALNVGVDGGLMAAYGRSGEFWTLILPHGMLELTAVFLATGVGLRLGWTVIDPGHRTRGRAVADEGRAMFTVAIGLVFVLLTSGLIEAFVTPSPLPSWARIGIGAVAEIAFVSYVFVFGRRAVAAGEIGDIAESPDTQPMTG
ncbi:MAG TPA: stage II sporulation protein M [Streptosporangiaceae bacterium]|nr:stage II sporulation protein M [Streptosporangiaceae bacterium]